MKEPTISIVDRVIAGYKASGIKPVKNSFAYVNNDGVQCGCAITALVVGEGVMTFDQLKDLITDSSPERRNEWENIMCRMTGMEYGAVWEFIHGYDDGMSTYANSPNRLLGVELRDKIFNERVLENDQ